MRHMTDFDRFIGEGVELHGDRFVLDFSGDKEGDIMSLKFASGKSREMEKDGVRYSYYFAYEFDNKVNPKWLTTVKKLDGIDEDQAKLMVSKAVMGFDKHHPLNKFDAIVYPKSSSVVLKKLTEQLGKKSGVAEMVPDAFVKAARSDIKFDYEAIDKLPDVTKKQVLKTIEKIKTDEGEFKLKTIFSRFRKFVKDFVVFKSAEDRHVHNLIVGKRVLLVDDYRTTGTTLKEMMNQLVKLQPEEIVVLILIKVV
jgi:hypothetical protein